jgi:hypothetical protein
MDSTEKDLLVEAMVMLENIERNREMSPTAYTQQQYVALGKRIREYLEITGNITNH